MTKAPNFLSLKNFMLKYSNPTYNNIWPTKKELIDLISSGKVDLNISRMLLNYLGFKFFDNVNKYKIGILAFSNWIITDIKERFNDLNLVNVISSNSVVMDFLKILSEYVGFTYDVFVPSDIKQEKYLGKDTPNHVSQDPSKIWDYADGYKANSDPKANFNKYDFMNLFINDDYLLNKLGYLNNFTIGKNKMSVDEYFKSLQAKPQRLGSIKIMAGGCKPKLHKTEKIYFELLNHLKANNLVLDNKDKINLEYQIINFKIYINRLDKITKKVSDNRNPNIDDQLKKNWFIIYDKFKKQEKKVFLSLSKIMEKTNFFIIH